MPALPLIDRYTQENKSPHVVILGAGASRASFLNGDKHGRRVPLMNDLIDTVGLGPILQAAGLDFRERNFEHIYDEVHSLGKKHLIDELQQRVYSYFGKMQITEAPTIYDLLLLSLRPKDLVATFNWDPFLAQAFKRNRRLRLLPGIVFLHGCVSIGICETCYVKGFIEDCCQKCGKPFAPTQLLYPVRQKGYSEDLFISDEWKRLRNKLQYAYFLTIFGYSAPKTDVEAIDLLKGAWTKNKTAELAQIEIIDIADRKLLESNWEDFFVRNHYSVDPDFWTSWLCRYPRRTCEALSSATLMMKPMLPNQIPHEESLSALQEWFYPLIIEEENVAWT